MTRSDSARCTLDSPRVQSTLDRLFREEAANDPVLFERLRPIFAAKKGKIDEREPDVEAVLKEAFIPVSREAGTLLYILARTMNAKSIVEFGTSYAISTIFLASAVRDNGGGRIITTEREPEKVRRARAHLEEAGLADLVEIREGDAQLTLEALEQPIDLLFLDGWKALYLPVLKLVERKLRAGTLVVADDLNIARETMTPFLDYVRTPADRPGGGRYRAVELPLGDAMELAVFVG